MRKKKRYEGYNRKCYEINTDTANIDILPTRASCPKLTPLSPFLVVFSLSLPGVGEELDAHLEEERGQAAGDADARVAEPPLPPGVVRRVVLPPGVLQPRMVKEFLRHQGNDTKATRRYNFMNNIEF